MAARVRTVLLPKDFVRLRLTGERATDASDASGTLLLDVRARDWSGELLEALEIPRAWLPARPRGHRAGRGAARRVADALGLPRGLPVAAGGGDNAAAAVGVGVVAEGLVSSSIGTSGVLFAHRDAFTPDPSGRVHAFCHAVPGAFHLMAVTLAAGGSLAWWRARIGAGASYDELVAEAAAVAPGAEGLVFLPYLSGERTPHLDPRARGAFVGLALHHTRGAPDARGHGGRRVLAARRPGGHARARDGRPGPARRRRRRALGAVAAAPGRRARPPGPPHHRRRGPRLRRRAARGRGGGRLRRRGATRRPGSASATRSPSPTRPGPGATTTGTRSTTRSTRPCATRCTRSPTTPRAAERDRRAAAVRRGRRPDHEAPERETVPVMRLLSVNVGQPREVDWRGRTVRTSIWKSAVADRRWVGRLNVAGDAQADLVAHGGEHRAVYVYDVSAYRHWERELGRDDFVPGQFGENFTVRGPARRRGVRRGPLPGRRGAGRGHPAPGDVPQGRDPAGGAADAGAALRARPARLLPARARGGRGRRRRRDRARGGRARRR